MDSLPNYSSFIGQMSMTRREYAMRQIMDTYFSLENPEEVILLAGGMPNPSSFPFKKFLIELLDGSQLDITVSLQ